MVATDSMDTGVVMPSEADAVMNVAGAGVPSGGGKLKLILRCDKQEQTETLFLANFHFH